MVRVSTTTNDADDKQVIRGAAEDHGDRVDRGVVLNEWVKSTAMFALRLSLIHI